MRKRMNRKLTAYTTILVPTLYAKSSHGINIGKTMEDNGSLPFPLVTHPKRT